MSPRESRVDLRAALVAVESEALRLRATSHRPPVRAGGLREADIYGLSADAKADHRPVLTWPEVA